MSYLGPATTEPAPVTKPEPVTKPGGVPAPAPQPLFPPLERPTSPGAVPVPTRCPSGNPLQPCEDSVNTLVFPSTDKFQPAQISQTWRLKNQP